MTLFDREEWYVANVGLDGVRLPLCNHCSLSLSDKQIEQKSYIDSRR